LKILVRHILPEAKKFVKTNVYDGDKFLAGNGFSRVGCGGGAND